MALKKFPYKKLNPLLKKYMDDFECSYTEYLFRYLRSARKRNWLTKDELIRVCNWKSSRSLQLIKKNSVNKIRGTTSKAFQSTNELDKIKNLIELQGVSIAMASAILMFIDPKNYSVIDIRVWEVLVELKLVNGNVSGKSLNINNWLSYLEIIRKKAKENKTTARRIEKAIFLAHKVYQEGQLY